MLKPLTMLNLSKEKLLMIIALVLAGVSLTVSIVLGLQVIKLKQNLALQPFPVPISTVTPGQIPTTSAAISPTVTTDEIISGPSETAGWKTHSNTFFGYLFKYPGDWQLTDRPVPQDGNWTYSTSVVLEKASGCVGEKSTVGRPWCGANFTLNVGRNTEGQTLVGWTKGHEGDLPANFDNVIVNGVEGVRFLETTPGHPYLQTEDKVGVVGFARNKKVFVLKYRVSGPDPGGSLFRQLELILSTFKFLPVSAEIEEPIQTESQCSRESGYDTCPQGYICYWSQACPKGIQNCGSPTGDFLCHKKCQSNSDCPGNMPFCKEVSLFRGDYGGIYRMCMK